MNYTGKVNGIDSQAIQGQPQRCQAFVNKSNDKYIQVTTYSHSLQTTLETACLLNVEVEVTYNENNSENIIERIRLLDR